MTQDEIQSALEAISAETDPPLKNLKLASLCSAVFRQRDIELVVVGGSAIEFYTDGAYTSGDVDLCVLASKEPLTARLRQELMGLLKGKGGPRSWQVAGAYVDILGTFETLARTPLRRVSGPYGDILIGPVEELIVERVLVSSYPQDHAPALDCAKKVIASGLAGEIEVAWDEVTRLAKTPAYANWPEVIKLIDEQAKVLEVRSPYHSDE